MTPAVHSGQPHYMAFGGQVMEGGCGMENRPKLNGENRANLSFYLGNFVFQEEEGI